MKFPALLFPILFAASAHGATVHLNQQISDCSTYNDATDTCGGGSGQSFNTWSEIETWLDQQGPGPDIVELVGGATAGDRKLLKTDGPGWQLDLSGDQCDGLTIRADAEKPFFHITSGMDVLTGWRQEYKASNDYPGLPGHVYSIPTPSGFRSTTYPFDVPVIESVVPGYYSDPERVVALYDAGQLEEWDHVTGTRWQLREGRNVDVQKGKLTPGKMRRGGDYYVRNGRLYLFTEDGNHPETSWTGQARRVLHFKSKHYGFRLVKCSDVKIDDVYFDMIDDPFEIQGSDNVQVSNFFFGRAPRGDRYYRISVGIADDGTKSSNVAFRDGTCAMTGAAFTGHRMNWIRMSKVKAGGIWGVKEIMCGGHGHHASEWQQDFSAIGTEHWGLGGKAENALGSKQLYFGNKYTMMYDAACTFFSVPDGFPGETGGDCPRAQEQSTNIGETETHHFISMAGSHSIGLWNQLGGAGGGWYVSGRKNYGFFGGKSQYNRLINNTLHSTFKNPPIPDSDNRLKVNKGTTTGISIQDGPTSYPGTVWKSGFINNALVHNRVRNPQDSDGSSDSYLQVYVEYEAESSSQSLSGRDVFFKNTLITAPNIGSQRVARIGPSDKTCSGFGAGSEVTGTVCSSTRMPVVSAPDGSKSGMDLRPIDTDYVAHDAGTAAATAIGSGTTAETIVVSDIWSFFDESWLGTHPDYKAAMAEAMNDVLERAPSAYIHELEAGEIFVMIDGVPGCYTKATPTTGNLGELELCFPMTWSNGDPVHPVPYAGDPDIGYFDIFEEGGGGGVKPPDSLSARPDGYTLAADGTRTVNVCANDSGTGDAATGFRVKAASLSDSSPIITALAVNSGDDCQIDITLAAGAGTASFSYAIEHVSAGIESQPTTVSIVSTDSSSVQSVFFYPSGVDIEPGSASSWSEQTVSGSPTDAKAIFSYAWNEPSSGGTALRQRPADSSSTTTGTMNANAGTFLLSNTDGTGKIDTYKGTANLLGWDALGYFGGSAVTDEGEASVSITCDSTWNTISESGKAVVAYAVDAQQDIAISFSSGGIEPRLKTVTPAQVIFAPVVGGNVRYKCSSGSGMRRILSVATGGGVILPSDFEKFTPSAKATAQTVSPSIDCGAGPCLGYFVYIIDPNRNVTRFNVQTGTSGLGSSDEGAKGLRFEIVEADSSGDFAIAANQTEAEFLVLAAITEGAAAPEPTTPTVLEISSCPLTGAVDGRTPDTTTHGGDISATSGVVCASGDITLPADDAFHVQTGTGDFVLDFMIADAAGVTIVEFDDSAQLHDYANEAPAETIGGIAAVLDWDAGVYSLERRTTGGQTTIAGPTALAGLITGDAYVRIESRTNSPISQHAADLYISGEAITDANSPTISGIHTSPDSVRTDTGALEFWQTGSAATFELGTQAIEVRSSTQVDSLAPDAPTVSDDTTGQQVSLSWNIPADNGGAVASYVKTFEIVRDTSATPTTVIASGLPATTVSYTEQAPGVGTYYYGIRARDASGNVVQSSDAQVTTATPNDAPTVVTPAAVTVLVGIDYESPITPLDPVALCQAVDPNGDALSLDSIKTAPERANAEKIGDSVQYQPAQGDTAVDSLTVVIRDEQGNLAPDCVIQVSVQTPPFILPELKFSTETPVGQLVNFIVIVARHGDPWQLDERVVIGQIIRGTGGITARECDEPHPPGCGTVKVSLEQDINGNPILIPGVGVDVTFVATTIDYRSSRNLPVSVVRGVEVEQ